MRPHALFPVAIPVALFLAACAGSTDTDPGTDGTDPSVEDAEASLADLDRLRDASASPVTHTVERGVPSSVFLDVPVARAAASDPVEAALTFLDDHAAFYRLSSARDQLQPRSVVEDEDGTHVLLTQRTPEAEGALPLLNGGLQVHLADGSVVLTVGRYVPDLAAPAGPLDRGALSGLDAKLGLDLTQIQGEPELGLFAMWTDDGVDDVRLAWRATVSGFEGPRGSAIANLQVDIDAQTGELLQAVSLIADAADKQLRVSDYRQPTNATGNCQHHMSWFYEDGPTRAYDASLDPAGDGQAAFDNAHIVYDYFAGNLDHCSYDGGDAEMQLVVYLPAVNAYANGACGTLTFGENMTGLDVVAHEFAHLVDHNHHNLEYQGLSGALDESFADVFGALLDGNWTIGEGTAIGVIRDLSDPPAHGHPDHVQARVSGDGQGLRDPSSTTDKGWVHVNSGIPNKAAWLAIEGGEHNGITVEGIGRDKGARLYHQVHKSLGGNANFYDARNLLVGFAKYYGERGVHGFEGREWCSVNNAFAAVGINPYLADENCDGVPDAWDGDRDDDGIDNRRDNCPDVPNPTQSDLDLDGEGDACDADDDNDGVRDRRDNCLRVANPDQADQDDDGIGDACDDSDRDRVLDLVDNCPDVPNRDQEDTDGDGVGDACDRDDDDDGTPDDQDACPRARDAADGDSDGVPDACDNCPDASNADQIDCDADGVGAPCDVDASEALGCATGPSVEMDVFVHPLEAVALPPLTWESGPLPSDLRLRLTLDGIGEGWIVVDRRGTTVAHSRTIPGGRAPDGSITTWIPRFDFSQGTRTTEPYRLLMPATLDDGSADRTGGADELEIGLVYELVEIGR